MQSGAGVFADNSKGGSSDSVVYDDTNVDQIKSIPDNAIHRNVDIAVIAADEEGYVRTYTVLPPIVYGFAAGLLFDLKLANPHPVLVFTLLRLALVRGRSGMVGKGENVWPLVHIEDLANLYILLLDTVLSDQDVGHGWNGVYVPARDHCMFKELSERVGQALVKLGKISEANPDSWSEEEIFKFWDGVSSCWCCHLKSKLILLQSHLLGGNVRYCPTRALSLGWNPHYTKDDFLRSVYSEAEAALASGALDQGYQL
jgi:nucleoside-diphosphate-sugar epimerase